MNEVWRPWRYRTLTFPILYPSTAKVLGTLRGIRCRTLAGVQALCTYRAWPTTASCLPQCLQWLHPLMRPAISEWLQACAHTSALSERLVCLLFYRSHIHMSHDMPSKTDIHKPLKAVCIRSSRFTWSFIFGWLVGIQGSIVVGQCSFSFSLSDHYSCEMFSFSSVQTHVMMFARVLLFLIGWSPYLKSTHAVQ